MSISVTNSLSLRLFYNSYSSVSHGSTRNSSPTGTLSMADASALRIAIRKLQDYDFEGSTDTMTQEKLKAFTDTMNNAITSATTYGKNDTAVKNAVNKLKNINSEYALELQKIGITLNKDGTMSLYESAAKNYSAKKFDNFFTEDSKYLKEVYDVAKRITRKVDVRI